MGWLQDKAEPAGGWADQDMTVIGHGGRAELQVPLLVVTSAERRPEPGSTRRRPDRTDRRHLPPCGRPRPRRAGGAGGPARPGPPPPENCCRHLDRQLRRTAEDGP